MGMTEEGRSSDKKKQFKDEILLISLERRKIVNFLFTFSNEIILEGKGL